MTSETGKFSAVAGDDPVGFLDESMRTPRGGDVGAHDKIRLFKQRTSRIFQTYDLFLISLQHKNALRVHGFPLRLKIAREGRFYTLCQKAEKKDSRTELAPFDLF